MITVAGGGVLLVAGTLWYATRGSGGPTEVTGWVTHDGGGLVAAGRF